MNIYGRLRKLEDAAWRSHTGSDEDLSLADEDTILAVAEEIRFRREIVAGYQTNANQDAILFEADRIVAQRGAQSH